MAPHVVVIPYPVQGHINPLIRLSEKLASQGILITFVNTEANHLRIMKSRSQVGGISIGPNSNIRFVQISDGLPADISRADILEEAFNAMLTTLRTAAEELIQNLITKPSEAPISCVIGSSYLYWTCNVAKKFNLPWVAFWSQCVSVYTIYRHLTTIISKGDFPAQKKGAEDRIDYIHGILPVKAQDLPENIQTGDRFTQLHHLVSQQLPLFDEAELIIGNTVYELESEASDAVKERAPLVSLGLFLPPAYFDGEGNHEDFSVASSRSLSLWEEFNCLPWLDAKPRYSVLYISFGSGYRLSKSQVYEIGKGLLESEQVFLWVIRPDTVTSENSTVDDLLPEGFMEKTKNRGLVVSWSPQLLVLSHPSIGGFFTHGGWNSTTESLSLGVPMLVFPLGADQYTNRMLIVDQWKVGLSLESRRDDGIVEGEEIARCVKALLGDEEMRRKSRQVREMIRKSVSEGGSSWNKMKDFVDYLMSGQFSVKMFQAQPDLKSCLVMSPDS